MLEVGLRPLMIHQQHVFVMAVLLQTRLFLDLGVDLGQVFDELLPALEALSAETGLDPGANGLGFQFEFLAFGLVLQGILRIERKTIMNH